jgi:hypothetical protein
MLRSVLEVRWIRKAFKASGLESFVHALRMRYQISLNWNLFS